MGFCQWFRYTLVTPELNVFKLLKLNSVYYNYSSNTVPNYKKMVFIRLLTLKDTWSSGMNLRTTPPAVGQKLSVQKGRFQTSDYVLKRVHYITSEKVKIIKVLCMKENN